MKRTLTLLALLLLTTTAAHAQWTNNPLNGMTRVTNEVGQDRFPSIANIGNNRILVLWEKYQDVRGKYQIFNQNGNPQLELDGLYLVLGEWYNCGIKYLISNQDGSAICVFEDWRSGTCQIYGQRIDADGNRLWGDNGLPLAIYPDGPALLKDAERDSFGNIFIACCSGNNPTNSIYIQKTNIEGQRLWGDYGMIDCGGVSGCDFQQIVPDGAGGVIDVWQDNRNGGMDPMQAYAQHLDANGIPLWTINGIPLHDPRGGWLLFDLTNGISDGFGGAYYAGSQPGTYNFTGVFHLLGSGEMPWFWRKIGANYYALFNLLKHSQTFNLWVSIKEYYPGYSTFNLYCLNPITGRQYFNSNGVPYGGEQIVPCGDGVIALRYSGVDLRAFRVDSRGNLLWERRVVRDALWFDEFASTSDSNGSVVVAFEDGRFTETEPDISAQRILPNGNLGVPHPPDPSGIISRSDSPLTLCFAGNLVTYQIPESGTITLELFDIMGRRVKSLYQGEQNRGSYQLKLDDAGLSSGIYILTLATSKSKISIKYPIVR
jgi:hypothetical protein